MAPLNCSVVPDTVLPDAGVAGTGVLLSFIITNFTCLLLSSTLILSNLSRKPPSSSPICRKLLLSFSDQQILTGIGIQSVALAKMHSMVPYHFFIVWLLSLLSTATNLATLLALVNEFKRDWVLRWGRQVLMVVNLGLQCVSGVFVLWTLRVGLEARLPIACVWVVESRGARGNTGVSIAGTIAVIAVNVVVFVLSTWYLHVRKDPRWIKTVQVIGLGALVAMGIGATVRVVLESQAFGTPPENVRLQGEGEKDWGYGQLLNLLMLILPVISAVEIVRGELRVGANQGSDAEEGDEGKLLGPGSEEMFQPNPLWGSRSNLVRR